jgi:hypothetical protein
MGKHPRDPASKSIKEQTPLQDLRKQLEDRNESFHHLISLPLPHRPLVLCSFVLSADSFGEKRRVT